MHPTANVEHLPSSVVTADDSDDMKIYQFDREASMDWFIGVGWTATAPGSAYRVQDEVLAA
ncbi:hypothetical protein [Lentzea jiangxiensis]|nr:hypothetical protein [Lentzea jiangxiensis]